MIKSRRLINAGHVVSMEEGRTAFKISTGKHTEKRPLGWRRLRWENNIKMNLKQVDINMRNWDDWAEDRANWKALINEKMSHCVS